MATRTKWAIDPDHSKLQFKVRHLAIANVAGTFKKITGAVETETDDFSQAEISFGTEAASIDTNNTERDNHLRSDTFLDVGKYPQITFSGTLQTTGDAHQLAGNLTLHGVTRPVVLQVEHTGTGPGRFNDLRAGFELEGKIYRKDFGLHFDMLNEAGSLLLGEEIKIYADIELIRDAPTK